MISNNEILSTIKELEKKAEAVLIAKKKLLARRPIVIEFSGVPKSGKSSCISSLDIFLRRNSFKTKVLTERASVCPIENKFDPLFNIWTSCAALNQLSEIIANRPRDYDIIIMDRGFFDSLCWFEWQKENSLLGDEDFKNFTSFFTTDRFRMMVDLVIHFDAMPKTALDREYKNLLTFKPGSVMRENVIEQYRAAAETAVKNYSRLFRQFTKFETDKLDQSSVAVEVTKVVLDKLDEVASEKICCIDRKKLESIFDKKNSIKLSEISEYIENNIYFIERKDVESDNTKIQFIPIALIKDKNELSFVVARKGRKATSPNSPEADKILLYFGGHVREEDKNLFNNSEIRDIFSQCIFREIKEELGIDVKLKLQDALCIWLRDGTRSENHMAVVFVVERDLKTLKLSVDEREFVLLTKKDKFGSGSYINELQILDNFDRIDNWSRIIIENLYSIRPNFI